MRAFLKHQLCYLCRTYIPQTTVSELLLSILCSIENSGCMASNCCCSKKNERLLFIHRCQKCRAYLIILMFQRPMHPRIENLPIFHSHQTYHLLMKYSFHGFLIIAPNVFKDNAFCRKGNSVYSGRKLNCRVEQVIIAYEHQLVANHLCSLSNFVCKKRITVRFVTSELTMHFVRDIRKNEIHLYVHIFTALTRLPCS